VAGAEVVLSDDLTTKLLGAIETDSLVFLCGAGLSVSPPSSLLSAVEVSRICYDARQPIEALDPVIRDRVDLVAGHFYARGAFPDFIRLVPWNELVGRPNKGHAAIADLLISRAAHAALSANFDPLIERWAEDHKIAMQGALDGREAVTFGAYTSPLIKFHGCLQRKRDETLWTEDQLTEAQIRMRMESCAQWMNLHLPNKHLVVVGFWTDWGFLNSALAKAFTVDNARSVTVIDPKRTEELEASAPVLWGKLTTMAREFEHVPESGDEALAELRIAYSRTWARKYYALGAMLAKGAGRPINVAAPFEAFEMDDLYNLRRDAEGIPYTHAAHRKAPATDSAQAASVHVMMLNAGATQEGAWLRLGGRSIRIINGAGQGLNDVKAQNKEPATLVHAEVVVCAGAVDLAVPARLISSGRGDSAIRPTPGGGARWVTLEQAILEFAL
jgi:hypothetical protein